MNQHSTAPVLPTRDNCAAVILAGGRSRRMGVRKSTLPWQGKRLIDHGLERLAHQVSPILISSNESIDALPAQAQILPDTLVDGGPLAGVLTALEWLQAHHPDKPWLLSTAVDTPLLPPDLREALASAWKPTTVLLAACYQGWQHPTSALWHVSLAEPLRHYLDRGERRVMAFVELAQGQYVSFDHHRDDPFRNLNTPDDLSAPTR